VRAAATRRPIGGFIHPHAESSKGMPAPYDADRFRYRMTAREIFA
jgi:hypothetical protein